MRLTWLADVLRATGLDVVEHGDWKSRGRDLLTVEGVVWHHTATRPTVSDEAVCRLLIQGRSDLPGPLCQLGLDRFGRYHLIAAGKGNHNGHGTWGNQSIGIEAFNDGVGEPWPVRQVDAFVRGTAAICRKVGWPASKVLGHKETDPTRKVDPRGIDMDVARARVEAALTPPVAPPKLSPPMEVDVNIQHIHLEVPVDGNGNGWTEIAYPIDRVIGIVGHSEVHPGKDGGYDGQPNSVTATPGDTGTVIVVKGQTPGWPAHVWVKVAV